MKSLRFRLPLMFALVLWCGGCASQPPSVELGWICGNGLFDDLPREKPCTGTKDLALAGQPLPPDGD